MMNIKYHNIQEFSFSGIYCITNTVNGKRYIGSAVNIKNRIQVHFKQLNKKIHSNTHLLRAWNKYGESCFEVTVLEKCIKEFLIAREQFYLDTLKPEYNICKVAGSTLGVPMKTHVKQALINSHLGKPLPESTKEKQRAAHRRNRFKNPAATKKVKLPRIAPKVSKKFLEAAVIRKSIIKGKSYEEIYGAEKSQQIKNKISIGLTKAYKDCQKTALRKKRIGGLKQSKEWVEKRTEARKVSIKAIKNTELTYFKSIKEASETLNISYPRILHSLNTNKELIRSKIKFEYV